MTSLVSPFKLFVGDLNYFRIGSNQGLGDELRAYFADPSNDDLWKLVTNRQRLTHALRFTETIHLYALKDLPAGSDTSQANQWMDIQPLAQSDIGVFKKAINWFEEILLSTGAAHVEFGRIFVSKLAAKSAIDTHTDSGKYFSYYDRFHFTVTEADQNFLLCGDDGWFMDADSLYWFNNHAPHYLLNHSSKDRINFIIDARLS